MSMRREKAPTTLLLEVGVASAARQPAIISAWRRERRPGLGSPPWGRSSPPAGPRHLSCTWPASVGTAGARRAAPPPSTAYDRPSRATRPAAAPRALAELHDGSPQSATYVCSNCCGGRCVNQDNDIFNCGGCGSTCPTPNLYCFHGKCSVPDCFHDPTGVPAGLPCAALRRGAARRGSSAYTVNHAQSSPTCRRQRRRAPATSAEPCTAPASGRRTHPSRPQRASAQSPPSAWATSSTASRTTRSSSFPSSGRARPACRSTTWSRSRSPTAPCCGSARATPRPTGASSLISWPETASVRSRSSPVAARALRRRGDMLTILPAARRTGFCALGGALVGSTIATR